ncbi:MAG: ATP-grasp domain-containing protein [Methylococcaceae bacterium]|nr:ATP-grasp domain-containing protein [Methylococcaceae bacterium]
MNKLKILVVEYITGGGFNKDDLPGHLANEGLLMLEALVNCLQSINGIELTGMLDSRLVDRLSIKLHNCTIVKPQQTFEQEFTKLIQTCDAVWPIAPESNGVLQTLCEIVESSGKLLLNSSASAVTLSGNKWLTFKCLQQHSINCVETNLLDNFEYSSGEWIIKPIDGVGCENSFLIGDRQAFDEVAANLHKLDFIIQPHLKGEKTSLSCLFKQGQGWLICANRQHFKIIDRQYHLTGITVNYSADISHYLDLVEEVAKAIPELWGYAGIDLIETEDKILVLEINPRLTTSFVGIKQACGINCAESVLSLVQGNPCLQSQSRNNTPVQISIE